MEVIIILTVLIGGISLYDYMSARRWAQVTSAQRNETVFANRNREYGAYQLRTGYDLRLLIIMGAMIFAIGTSYAVYYIVSSMKEEVKKESKLDLTQFSMDAPKIEEPLDPPKEVEIPPMEKTIQFLAPVVLDDAKEEEMPTQDDVKDVTAGTQDNDTENEGFVPIKEEKKPEPEPEPEPEIFKYVEESAEFPGGVNAMRKFLAENIVYPQTARDLGLEGKCFLTFVVSSSGNISNVTIQRGVPDCPECDKEAVRVIKNMPKWKPGKNGGKAVNSTFNLPVTFTLQ
jgi:protein TonB